jgi:hypothetical protein
MSNDPKDDKPVLGRTQFAAGVDEAQDTIPTVVEVVRTEVTVKVNPEAKTDKKD